MPENRICISRTVQLIQAALSSFGSSMMRLLSFCILFRLSMSGTQGYSGRSRNSSFTVCKCDRLSARARNIFRTSSGRATGGMAGTISPVNCRTGLACSRRTNSTSPSGSALKKLYVLCAKYCIEPQCNQVSPPSEMRHHILGQELSIVRPEKDQRVDLFAASPPLKVASYGTTPNGFNGPARGWNSWAIQVNNAVPSWTFDQRHVQAQCDVLASQLTGGNFTYCSLDSGWSMPSNGDSFGRIMPDTSKFSNLPGLASHLHGQGLQLGVYVVPGAFSADSNKPIRGTNVKIGAVCTGNNGLSRCNFDYSRPATQQWHNSVVNQFASWGVDYIKLDFVTPGSPDSGVSLPSDTSGAVIAWHKAIAQSGRRIRLDISWKLDRSATSLAIWNSNADSMRTDNDINNSASSTLTQWSTVQRAVENYRQWIVAGLTDLDVLHVHPDMDNLFVANDPTVDGISTVQQQTMVSHWIGAGANLMLGDDLTRLTSAGRGLLTNPAAQAVAAFTAQYPMQPRNPGTGGQDAKQLQAWIAGPSLSGEAVLVLANYGPDEGQGGFGTGLAGPQQLSITWDDLGFPYPPSGRLYDVWNDRYLDNSLGGLTTTVGEGQTLMLYVARRVAV
ncbi:hypothetical protein ANO11243_084450 [Dothideomycetidae sp. 11243]|nr:hypothetical protein ANO11243_084450 [fungal sp. No.11243]